MRKVLSANSFLLLLTLVLMLQTDQQNSHAEETRADSLFGFTNDFYRALRVQAIAAGCNEKSLPARILINHQAEIVNASASFDNHKNPQIIVNKGLLDLSSITAYYSMATDLKDRERALVSIWHKVKNPELSLRATIEWNTFANAAALPWAWRNAFLSRVAFDLAHEMAHHCLGHIRKRIQAASSLSLETSDGEPIAGLEPAVSYDRAVVRANPPTAESVWLQNAEAAADTWAIDLLQKKHDDLHLDQQATPSAVAELALLDAAGGYSSLSPEAASWNHPVGYERFQQVYKHLVPSIQVTSALEVVVASPYLEQIEKLILCLERATRPADLFDRLVNTNASICAPINVTRETLSKLMPRPLQQSATAAEIMIAIDGNRAIPVIRNATDDKAAYSTYQLLTHSVAMSRWLSTIGVGQEYALDFLHAPEGGAFTVYVNGKTSAVGNFKANGVIDIIDATQSITAVKNGKLFISTPIEFGPH